jgi:transposase-like protein
VQKKNTKVSSRKAAKSGIPKEVLDTLLGAVSPEAKAEGTSAILKELTAAVVNRALEAELTEHLDYEDGEPPPEMQTNRRNGHRKKVLRTEHGEVDIKVPRDREGTFEPKLVEPYQRSIPGFDEKIISMYARGLSTRDIQGHFEELYGVDVSPDLVSRVTDAVVDELKAWQGRLLQALYPIVYIDALVVKVRDGGVVENKSLYLVIGVDDEGQREVLGMWLQKTEGAKFWLSILTELRNRGVEDILFLCADGLTGLPDAVEAAFPKTVFQTCIVHLIRASTRLVPWKDKREVCADLRPIYSAPSEEAAMAALDEFEGKWSAKYPMVAKAWRSRAVEWTPFLRFSAEIRHAIYTTNVIEATNRQLRKVLKTKGHLPNDAAVLKLAYLVLKTCEKGWRKSRRSRDWATVRLQLNVHFEDRFPVEL